MSNQAPNIWKIKNLYDYLNKAEATTCINGKWVPARPLGYPSLFHRIKSAYLAFTGKVDVVKWDFE